MKEKNKRKATTWIMATIIAILIIIILLMIGCKPTQQSGLGPGTSEGNTPGTAYSPAPCTRCNSTWTTRAWVCSGTCDNGGICNNVGLYQSTDPSRQQDCTCGSQTQTYTCERQGGFLSSPTCGGTCPTGQSCLMQLNGNCACGTSTQACTSIIPYKESDCSAGYCSYGRCGFIASTGGQGIGYCTCSTPL